jgi:endonuclease/exonuclease/phosphatase family metal-dependent hydrolase
MPQNYIPPSNDRLSKAFKELVPLKYYGSDRFIDLVTWNVRYFNNRDPQRVACIVGILNALNADVIVLQEVEDGSLATVAEQLTKAGAGHYKVAYGTTGGDQRIAMMYDLDWIRSKDTVGELFHRGEYLTRDKKEAFWRLPLWGYFIGISHVADPFDFQILGVHLKSQRGGGDAQRRLAARALAKWLVNDAPKVDADIVITGDWNAPPSDPAWAPLHDLEKKNKALFTRLNDVNEISHLMFRNKKEIGSRLDLEAVTIAASKEMAKDPMVVRWKSLDNLLSTNPDAKTIKKYIHDISYEITDHMPVVTRFYFEEK